MASAIIHICVAKKIGERLNKSSKDYYLGTIAPDISKEIGETKYKSHFLENSIKIFRNSNRNFKGIKRNSNRNHRDVMIFVP